jgi:hypothetical protein
LKSFLQVLLAGRLLRAYGILCVGLLFFLLRRVIFPTSFEVSGMPLSISSASALNQCTYQFSLSNCGDAFIVVLTTIGMLVAYGWGRPGLMVFAFILGPLPIAVYFLLAPPWLLLVVLLAIPLVLEIGLRLLLPDHYS